MKLINLQINRYKNLKVKASFDFLQCSNYVALIGLNGSGKSNILEAISIIFNCMFQDKPTDFDYRLKYIIDDKEVIITNGVMLVKGIGKIQKKKHKEYLPSNVIASYSGEELRMWEEIYLESYSNFFQDIKKQSGFVPDLLYVNKYCWSFGLIALLCSDDIVVQNFVRNELDIPEDVILQFEIKKDNYPLYEENAALSLVRRLVELQEVNADHTIHINEIKTLDIGQRNNKDLVQKIFYYLFIAGMPVKGDKIKADKIIRSTQIKFNGVNVKQLSEGEKKLILIYCITHILADKRSLILLDEPDAHLHIQRKREVLSIIEKAESFTLFTTHSPTVLNHIPEFNVQMIKSSDQLEVVNMDRFHRLEHLTDGEFSFIDASFALSTSKDILLVEGTLDYKYFMRAIEILKRTKTPKYDNFEIIIINCGSAGNIAAVLREFILKYITKTQLCIATFDDDSGGAEGEKAVLKMLSENPHVHNVQTMKHPKLVGWSKNEFFTEDYFSVSAYKNTFEEQIRHANSFKDLESLQKVKGIIASRYKTFPDNAFDNFQVFFDEIVARQMAFRNPH